VLQTWFDFEIGELVTLKYEEEEEEGYSSDSIMTGTSEKV
jgi:hypothetical protein